MLKKKRKNYSVSVREAAVLRVIKSVLINRLIISKLDVDHKLIHRWVAMYKKYGIEGLTTHRMKHLGEFKLPVVTYMQKNVLSLYATAVHFGITDQSVRTWKHKYETEWAASLCEDKQLKDKKMSSKKGEKS